MNIQQLIDELQKIEDKSQVVYYYEKYWDDEHTTLSEIEIVEPNNHQCIGGELTGIVIHPNYND